MPRKSTSNILFPIFFLLLTNNLHACLGTIDPTLGVNPSFFNMSEKVSREIYSLNISADEKFYLLVYNTFSETSLLSSIRSYNLLLPFSCPPAGTEVVSKKYIHNAWVRAITVMPSVMDEEGNYWAPPKGEVLIASNHSIQLPRSATNAYPDCGIVYTLLKKTESLSVCVNGLYTGSSMLTNYETLSSNLEARAELILSADVKKDNYAPVCYCCKSGKDGCEATCCSCEFSNSELEEEYVKLNSSLERRVYRLEASSKLTMLRCPENALDTASGNLSVVSNAPFQSLLLSFGSANISLQAQKLDIRTILKPHNVLEAQALQHVYQFSENMFLSDFTASSKAVQLNFTAVPYEEVQAPYASLVLVDLFGVPHNISARISCPLNPQMDITMPHWAEKGSEFHVVVKLSEGSNALGGKEVTLHYSGENYTGATSNGGEVVFSLKANQSLVEAESEYDGTYAEVHARGNLMVYEPSIISYLLSFLAFLFILVVSYIGFRRIGGGWK